MFETINKSNFEEKVLKADKPVLLSYLHKNHDYQEYLKTLAALAEKFQGKVEMYLLKNGNTFITSKFCILGDPTFITFNNGRETGRLLGKVMFEELVALCNRMLTMGR